MPEPQLYLQAMGAAAFASAMFVLAVAWVRRPIDATWLNSASVLGIGLGVAVGYYVLSFRLPLPPMNGLDRFLTIVLPAVLTIELISGFHRVPRRVAWSLRLILSAVMPRILLHDSVYLSGFDSNWTLWQAVIAIAVCGALLAGLWGLLSCLSKRCPGVSIPLALCLTIQCVGLTVMMAGYIKGGAAAFPLAATLLGTVIGAKLVEKLLGVPVDSGAPAILGIGVVGLFSLLVIGWFFGRLTTDSALAMLLAPLLCWVTETPLLKHRKPWLVGSIRLALVTIPLVVVLALVKCDFDRDMAPLLTSRLHNRLDIPHTFREAPPPLNRMESSIYGRSTGRWAQRHRYRLVVSDLGLPVRECGAYWKH